MDTVGHMGPPIATTQFQSAALEPAPVPHAATAAVGPARPGDSTRTHSVRVTEPLDYATGAAGPSHQLPMAGSPQPRQSCETCCTCGQAGQNRDDAAAECRTCGHVICTNWCILWQDRWGVLCRCCLGDDERAALTHDARTSRGRGRSAASASHQPMEQTHHRTTSSRFTRPRGCVRSTGPGCRQGARQEENSGGSDAHL